MGSPSLALRPRLAGVGDRDGPKCIGRPGSQRWSLGRELSDTSFDSATRRLRSLRRRQIQQDGTRVHRIRRGTPSSAAHDAPGHRYRGLSSKTSVSTFTRTASASACSARSGRSHPAGARACDSRSRTASSGGGAAASSRGRKAGEHRRREINDVGRRSPWRSLLTTRPSENDVAPRARHQLADSDVATDDL